MGKPRVIIISPASAKANNGNWHTAARWKKFLAGRYQVSIAQDWQGGQQQVPADLMIALHARRSANAIHRWAEQMPQSPLIVALTGTDLYRDIATDVQAQQSLQLATHLVVLQAQGLAELAPPLRAKTSVIYQSARSLKPLVMKPDARIFPVIMIGHLRAEKMPHTYMQAAGLVHSPRVRLRHVGGALDPALEAQALHTARHFPSYQWLGALPHARTRQLLRKSAVMVIASAMEGGANVIIEAVTSGVAVLASDVPGNRGMLGCDYAGYFPLGDSTALATLINKLSEQPALLALLQQQCALRAALFAPAREQAGLLQLVDNALNSRTVTQGPP